MPEHRDNPSLTSEEWQAWFSVQAGWTQPTRMWLYRQAGLAQAGDILEVGCGTGVVAGELTRLISARVVGLDIDSEMLSFARRQQHGVTYVQGDVHTLPFSDGSFDAVVCHYLLLWLANPARGVREMARVIRPGGHVLACAEPDYGGRVDHPPEMASLGRLQAKSLRQQGVNPEIGRRLGGLFVAAGLQATVGVMAGRWELPASPDGGFEAEWAMRARDLAGLVPPEELCRLRSADHQALAGGQRTLFIPTFYALGKKML
ncbi:MAG: methyltransferase domain-containing protein [Chloroflexota bacterium]|nr:methyltransferase domain-containing protein [Chloroflexota bacterium]